MAVSEKAIEAMKRHDEDSEEMKLRGRITKAWICPDCGGRLKHKIIVIERRILRKNLETNILHCPDCGDIGKLLMPISWRRPE